MKTICTEQHNTESSSSYHVTIGRDNICVVNVFCGTQTASQVIYDAAVKKILYDHTVDE